MFNLQVGQTLEFVEPATSDGKVIAKGTRVRVGHIMAEFGESKVTLVVLDQGAPQTLVVDRHIVTVHCRSIAHA